MSTIFARKALLSSGWADDVRLQIEDGRLHSVDAGACVAPEDTRADCVIPGLCNSHSHAFQRALAGRTEERSPAGRDNFWTWRERMYELAAAMTADRLRAVARQAYIEMVSSGYTSVAEFHYLHKDPAGGAEDAMFEAIRSAADDSGIRITYVPTMYERAGFGRTAAEGAQTLFAQSIEDFLQHHERIRECADGRVTVGIGAHSIRAVSAESLEAIADTARTAEAPMHIHIAEQQQEVTQCLSFYERRPVRWLLENFDVGSHWCLVHATHMDDDEVKELAGSGAVVSLCPSTEANLGDGLFRLGEYLEAGGRIAIGSDSQVSINPFEELRWLEYGQRLLLQERNIAANRDGHAGRELFERAVDGGAQACGQHSSGIGQGGHADLVCLYGEDPMLVGHDDESRLDALVFSGYRLPIERVMIDGEWVVIDGAHVALQESREAYARAVEQVSGSGR